MNTENLQTGSRLHELRPTFRICSQTPERACHQTKSKGTCGYLFAKKYGLKKLTRSGRPLWELKFTHINVHTYYRNFCPVSQAAKRWNALVIKII